MSIEDKIIPVSMSSLTHFTPNFLQSCTKSVFFNPRSISCYSASLDDFLHEAYYWFN